MPAPTWKHYFEEEFSFDLGSSRETVLWAVHAHKITGFASTSVSGNFLANMRVFLD
jgi:3-isopropylmalate dehydratase small subunit